MTKRFRDYLASIGMKEKAFLARVESALTMAATVSGQAVADFLVEDIVQEDGTRKYLHVAAFTRDYIVGVSDFLTEDKTEVFRLGRGVVRFAVATTRYDLKAAKPESRILVEFELVDHPDMVWSFQGSGTNCDHIWTISTKHVRKQLAVGA